MPYTRPQLKRFFEEFSRAHYDNETFGWSVDDCRQFDREMYERVKDSVKEVGSQSFEAPSSWEAAVFLMDRQARQGCLQEAPQLSVGETFDAKSFKLIFRGQKAQYDNIRPSAWRLARDKVEQNKCLRAAFCFLVKEVTEKQAPIRIPAFIYEAAAQHYGIPTDLVDLTVDPSVAVWFAHYRRAATDTHGCVYFTTLEHVDQFTIVLPPPFVHRLYKQRGLFHFTTSEVENAKLFADCSVVKFPLDTGFRPPTAFPFHQPQRLMVPDDFLTSTVLEAEQIALSVPPDHFSGLTDGDETTRQAAYDRLRQQFSPQITRLTTHHPFSAERWDRIAQQWIMEVHRQLQALCTFVTSDGRSYVATNTLFQMVEYNRDALDLYCNWIFSRDDPAYDGRKHICRDLRQLLDERYPELRERPWRLRV